MSIRQTLPAFGVFAIMADWILFGFDFLLSASELLYPMLAIGAGPLGEHVSWLDPDLLTNLLVIFAMMWLINLSIRFWRKSRDGKFTGGVG